MTAPPSAAVLADAFRAAMARVPNPVTIVTTRDENGRPWGFTASSFCSVSLNPPLVLVSLAQSANCHPAFARCTVLAVSVLQPEHAALARRFASKTGDKFAGAPFTRLPTGVDVVAGAVAIFGCTVARRIPAGDHTIILGRVQHAEAWPARTPAVYLDRAHQRPGPAHADTGLWNGAVRPDARPR